MIIPFRQISLARRQPGQGHDMVDVKFKYPRRCQYPLRAILTMQQQRQPIHLLTGIMARKQMLAQYGYRTAFTDIEPQMNPAIGVSRSTLPTILSKYCTPGWLRNCGGPQHFRDDYTVDKNQCEY